MMNTSTKLIATGAASLLGVALAAGGAFAATGSLTAADAPGRVLQVSGVAPAAAQASPAATAHANAKAKGLFGATTTHLTAHATSHATAMTHRSVAPVARPSAQVLPAYHAVMSGSAGSTQPAVPQPADSPAGMMTSVSPMR